MAKFFDIRPPKPKPTPAPAPRRNRRGCGWFVVLILLVLIGLFAWQMPSQSVSNGTKTSSTPNQNNFELFDQSGQSNLTKDNVWTVRILNASGGEELVPKAQKLLTDAGLKIEQVGKSENLYEQTIIYYKKDQEIAGQKVNDLLKSDFLAKLQESENLGSTYDVLVIVGQK